MNYLRIENKGEIALEALTLMGATSKEADQSKIGFFGSGNKYALATLLRKEYSVSIFSGQCEYVISTETVYFRGQSYDKIIINGNGTSLTTRLGPGWEVWMALREFYANAIDEGEADDTVCDTIEPAPEGRSYIYVEYRDEVEEFYIHKGKYFNSLPVLDELYTCYGKVTILEGENGQRYRKGISCVMDDGKKSLFGYDFDDIQINESRLINMEYLQYERIACALAMTNMEEVIRRYIAMCLSDDYIEYKTMWEPAYCRDQLSSTWEKVLLSFSKPIISISHASFINKEELVGSCVILPDALSQKIQVEIPSVPYYGDFNMESVEAIPTAELRDAIEKAAKKVSSWGFNSYNILYRKFMDSNVKARAYEGSVYISVDMPLCMNFDAVLLEEFIHLSTGLSDCSRSMQTRLFKWLAEVCDRLTIASEKLASVDECLNEQIF